MKNLTACILYYSSNEEKPEFEAKIVENLLKNCGDLPIVSITHKPMKLGRNVCVGDVGVSGFNMFRQVLIGCEVANTDFVISAESDCLYPPDYFTFRPEREDVCYRNTNLYVMPQHRAFFWLKKEGATHAQIVGRGYYLQRLRELFIGAPVWSVKERNFPKERHKKEDIFDQVEYYHTENPIIQIKTGRGMRHYTHSERNDIHELPYWGKGKDIYKQFL